MPGRTLPVISPAQLRQHKSATSCYVSYAGRVFDVTSFLEDHPGGGDLILEYGGRDVQEIMRDEPSHLHSETAYEILEDCVVGILDTDRDDGPNELSQKAPKKQKPSGVTLADASPETVPSMEAELSIETDTAEDFRKHRFLDLERPLFMQVWNGGFSKEFYLTEVHRPRHYKGGKSAPLFGNFLEPLSKTPWWIVPTLWLPPVIYGTFMARGGLSGWTEVAAFWTVGLAVWTLVEYGLHRGLFHVDTYLPDNRLALTLHFLLHGIHHYLPMDKLRLVMPPALFVILATPFWKLARLLFFWNWYAALAAYCGGIFGYICYDVTHYVLHHRTLPAYYRELKKYHLQHHYSDYQNGFGVTSRFWDRVFGTELAPPRAAKAA